MGDPIARLTTVLEGRYAIERELGAGGMATVYLAHDVRHDRKVALKVLRPELSAILGAERFLHEIKTTANLQHPHILSLFDSGEADGLVFYVMPYVEGESLRDRLNREKQLPVEDAVRIAREVADALDYAHRHGVVHRDIKPENILLHDGRAQVADFGIALAVSRSDGGTRMTETGMSLGTPHYMAPEQAMGEREITPKADIYALGVVLYEMLTAEPPFVGATAQAIIARVMTEEPRSLTLQRKTIPPHIEAACTMALAKLPADRFATAAQFGEALGRADFALPRTRAMPAGAAAAGRRLPAYAAWVVAALAALVAAFGWLRPHRASEVQRFGVVLPDSMGARTDHNGTSVVLSPDGSRLVYTGAEAHAGRQLYVREMGQLIPRALPGTIGAESPFFSPDGEWVAFFADGKLKKVALAGGPPLTLADASSGRGGAWSGDGHIVFCPSTTSPLLRISAAGGPADTLTTVRVDSGEGSHRWPEFLPGGRALVFTTQYQGGTRYRIMGLDLKTRVVKPLIEEAMDARYAGTGHLVYASDAGALLAMPFDASRLAVTGSPVSLLEGLMVKPPSGAAEFTTSRSGTLVYLTGAAASRTLMLVDRHGVEQQLGEMFALSSPRFSPDGRRIAVSSVEGRSTDIRILDLQRKVFSRLTFEGNNFFPEWTPDGRRVSFYAIQRPGAQGTDLYWTAADGSGGAQPLLTAPSNQTETSWAPGGRSLVFRQLNTGGRQELWVLPVDSPRTPRPYLQSAFNYTSPTVSPDGHWIAYLSDESGRPEIYVRSFPEPAGRWQISVNGGTSPRWAHSGRELFYRSGDSLVSVGVTTRPTFTVGQRKVLFVRPYLTVATHAHFDVSPDDRHFVMVSEGADRPGLVVALNWFEELKRRNAGASPAAR